MPLSMLNEPGGGGVDGDEAEPAAPIDLSLLKDRNQAFEAFRKSYRRHEAIEENKAILKGKYAEVRPLPLTLKAHSTHTHTAALERVLHRDPTTVSMAGWVPPRHGLSS